MVAVVVVGVAAGPASVALPAFRRLLSGAEAVVVGVAAAAGWVVVVEAAPKRPPLAGLA